MKQVIKTTGTLFFLLSANFISIVCAGTGFVISAENSILLAKNEDSYNQATRIWFIPSEDEAYGCVYFGFDKSAPLSAMNEQGLVMERFIELRSGSRPMAAETSNVIDYDRIMRESATVTDVLAWFDRTGREQLGDEVILFADRSNRAILVKKETIIFKDKKVMIHTSPPDQQSGNGDQPDWRRATVENMLSGSESINVDLCRNILEAISQDMTQYSNIYEIRDGTFYLHHFHQFDNYLQFDLSKELQAGPRQFEIPDLFPDNAEFQYIYLTRFSPQNNIFILLLLIVTGLFYAVTLIAWFSGWLIRRQDTKDYGRAVVDPGPGWVASAARVTAGLACCLGLGFLAATYACPQFYQYGYNVIILPRSLINLIAFIPVSMLFLSLPVAVFTYIAWCKNYWIPVSRWHYSLLTVILIVNIFLWFYWDLIQWP